MGTTEIIQTVINYPCCLKIQVHVHLGMRGGSNYKLSHSTSLFYPSNYASQFVTQQLYKSVLQWQDKSVLQLSHSEQLFSH